MMQTSPQPAAMGEISLSEAVGLLARTLASNEVTAAELAALKRMTPYQRPRLALLRLAFRTLPGDWENRREEWMTLIAGMAWMCPHPHDPGRSVGRTLAEYGFSESRLERLLGAEGETLFSLIMRVAFFLGTKGVSVDWVELAGLLFAQEPGEREGRRLRIAREFYRPHDFRHRKT